MSEFLKNLRDAVAIFGIAVVVDSIAKNTMKEDNISILLGYARLTAVIIIASSVKKIIMNENTLEEEYVEVKEGDIEEDNDGVSSSDAGGMCGSQCNNLCWRVLPCKVPFR